MGGGGVWAGISGVGGGGGEGAGAGEGGRVAGVMGRDRGVGINMVK